MSAVIDNIADSMHDASESFKMYYANQMIAANFDGVPLSSLAIIAPYSNDMTGDIYICLLDDEQQDTNRPIPYMSDDFTAISDVKDCIKYIITLHDRDPKWIEIVFEYLHMVCYACSSGAELLAIAKIPNNTSARSIIKRAYYAYHALINSMIEAESVLKAQFNLTKQLSK
jgi:hypothetical protein